MLRDTDTSNELQRPESETALAKVESDKRPQEIDNQTERQLARRQAASAGLRTWAIRAGVLALLLLIGGFLIWRSKRPTPITTIQPKLVPITETVASSGRVSGATETFVGAQTQGVVGTLSLLIEHGLIHEISKDEHRQRVASLPAL